MLNNSTNKYSDVHNTESSCKENFSLHLDALASRLDSLSLSSPPRSPWDPNYEPPPLPTYTPERGGLLLGGDIRSGESFSGTNFTRHLDHTYRSPDDETRQRPVPERIRCNIHDLWDNDGHYNYRRIAFPGARPSQVTGSSHTAPRDELVSDDVEDAFDFNNLSHALPRQDTAENDTGDMLDYSTATSSDFNSLVREAQAVLDRLDARDVSPPRVLDFAAVTDFTSHHLTPLLPGHPQYPAPDSVCGICQDPFNIDHAPILVVNIHGCQGHMFGYQCLRRSIGSGMRHSNKCPLCRTTWFDVTRKEVRALSEQWKDIEGAEARALGEDTHVEEKKQEEVEGEWDGFELF